MNRTCPFVVFALFMGASEATAQCSWVKTEELMPSQAVTWFGVSAALSGDLAVVCSSDGWGWAFVFDANTAEQLFAIQPGGLVAGDRFAQSMAMDGDIAIFGKKHFDYPWYGNLPGSAYLYNVRTGALLHELVAEDATPLDDFGQTVDIEGSLAIVGDPGVGAAYLFDVATGQQLTKFTAGPYTGGTFGVGVALGSGFAVVGHGGRWLSQVGRIHVFDVATYERVRVLEPSNGTQSSSFGTTLALGGGYVAVGSPYTADGGVFVFDLATGSQVYRRSAATDEEEPDFGRTVAIDGDELIVSDSGYPLPGGRWGRVCLYDLSSGTLLTEAFSPTPGSLQGPFGEGLAKSGDRLLIGEPGFLASHAYLFDRAEPCAADINGDCGVNFFDVQLFLNCFACGDPRAELVVDGAFDFYDVQAFLDAFSAGCGW